MGTLGSEALTATTRAVIELLVELEAPSILAGDLALWVHLGSPSRPCPTVWLPRDLDVVSKVVREARRRGLAPDDGEDLPRWLVEGPNGTTLGPLGQDEVHLTCTTGSLDFDAARVHALRDVTQIPVLGLRDLIRVAQEVPHYASADQRAALERRGRGR